MDICLNVEEPVLEATLHSMEKNNQWSRLKRGFYKYPRAQKFLTDLMKTHSPAKLQDLLTTGMDFPDLGIFKIAVEHPVPGFNNFIAISEERHSTHFDISISPEEEYVEEIDLADYIQAILISPAIGSRATMPTDPVIESVRLCQHRVHHKRLLLMRARGFISSLQKKHPQLNRRGLSSVSYHSCAYDI